MRILTTSLCYPTPQHFEQGLFIQRRAAALANRGGSDVQVVSPQPWCPGLRRCPLVSDAAWPLPATYPRMISIPVLNWATDGVAFGKAIARHIMRHGGPSSIDLIDAHFVYPDGVGAWLAGRRLGIPVVVTVRGKIVSLSRRAIRRMQIARMLRGVDARIAVSRSLAGWVRRIGGDDLDVDVIPNGVEPGVFYPMDRRQARTELGWDADARYLLAVGHLQRIKGFDRIVGVMPEVRAHLGDVRLVLAGSHRGEWWFRQRLRRLIGTCGGEPAVTFVGTAAADRLNLMYNAADLFVNASRSEGWSNAIAEALAAGTPVVATDVGGNAEQICSAQLGRVVRDADDHALAGAIVEALGADWNRVLIAAHGGARGWGEVAREVQAVFDRVVQARHAAAAHRPVRLFGIDLRAEDVAVATGPRPASLEVSR
ncbi:MAG: glycosyltransferase [Planctomycetes bacterium]|nr:glycosyltransferase [Planctomycetota bacterium]